MCELSTFVNLDEPLLYFILLLCDLASFSNFVEPYFIYTYESDLSLNTFWRLFKSNFQNDLRFRNNVFDNNYNSLIYFFVNPHRKISLRSRACHM